MDHIEIAVVVFGSLWTFFRASSWLFLKRNDHLERLFQALEVGVFAAWEQVVKPYLEKNGDGAALPPDIRRAAETVAVTEAAKTDRIVRKFPPKVIRATLKAAIEEAKRRGGKR